MTGAGLRAVFLSERKMLLRLLTARLGGVDDAEDALQDLWLKLETHATGPVAQPAAYLYRMANNIALDRRRSATAQLSRETGWLEVQSTAEEIPGIEATLIARERLARVEALLAAMPEAPARAFRRFRFDGASQKEIAAEMGISLSSLEKLLQQAYRRIHGLVRENPAGDGRRQRRDNEEDVDP